MKYQVGDVVMMKSGREETISAVLEQEDCDQQFAVASESRRGEHDFGGGWYYDTDIIYLVSRERPQRSKADRVLIELANVGEEYSMSFKSLMNQTGLSEFEVSACCRYLACEGYARFTKGLMNYEEMQVAGAGYAVTPAGVARVREWL